MRKFKIVIVAILLCLCLTASHARANGCYYGGYGAGYWALPLIFLGIPVLAYALSGGYSGAVFTSNLPIITNPLRYRINEPTTELATL